MKEEKLKIIEFVKELNRAIDKYLINIPHKELELKRKIKDSAYELLLITYEANITMDNQIKIKIKEKAIALIKFIDFLINECYEKQIINSKKYMRYGELLEKILRYYMGWLKSDRKMASNNNIIT